MTATPSGTGLASATVFAFSVTSLGDEYSWDFGDGTTATGRTPTHVFAAEGSYSVTVTVRNGGGQTPSVGNVRVRSLTGVWFGTRDVPIGSGVTERSFTVELSQRGSQVSGTYLDVFGPRCGVQGEVAGPRGVHLNVQHSNALSARPLEGEADDAVARITGTDNLQMWRQ